MSYILEGNSAQEFMNNYIKDIGIDFIVEGEGITKGDIRAHPTGDVDIEQGINAVINEIRARLLTRREVIIDGKTYSGETSDPNFGSALFYMKGKKKTTTNIKMAMLYIIEALIDMPYIDILNINAEVYPSDDVNKETVKINLEFKISINVENLIIQGDVIRMDVIYWVVQEND